MTPHPAEARAAGMLSDLEAQTARCDASEDAIRKGAGERLAAVAKRMEELRPRVLLDAGAADEYQGLVVERHRLNGVVMAP